MATHSSTLTWKIPWMEEPGGLQSMGSLRVGHDWATSLSLFTSCIGEGNGNPLRILAWRIPGMGEPGGLLSMESHRVWHDWSDLAAAAGTRGNIWLCFPKVPCTEGVIAGVLFLPFVFITHILWACVSMCQAKLKYGNYVPDSLLFLTYYYLKNTHIALLICQAHLCSSAGKESAMQEIWVWFLGWEDPLEEGVATHSSILAWRIPWTEEPGGLQSMRSLRVRHDWVTSLSLFTFMHWRRKWQPTPVFLPGESQGRGSLVGCCLWSRTESDTTEVT